MFSPGTHAPLSGWLSRAFALTIVGGGLLVVPTTIPAQSGNLRGAVYNPRPGRTNPDAAPADHPSEAASPFEQSRPKRIFFPPNPPPLGVEIPADLPEPGPEIPAALADFVNEPFYAPVSTRLADGAIFRSLQKQLAGYLTGRDAARAELRAKLESLDGLAPEDRRSALEAFASTQSARLLALEKTADDLRVDAFRSSLTTSGAGNWFSRRTWRLGRGTLDRPREQNRLFEFQLIRAAAYYQPGPTPAQRRLLREAAIELEEDLFRRDEANSSFEWFIFFSPDLARIHLPENLPASIAAKFAAYREQRAALKTELRDALYELDRAGPAAQHESTLAALADRQARELADLESKADAIRDDLAAWSGARPPTAPRPLPPGLAEKIADFQREKNALEARLADRQESALRELAPVHRDSSLAAIARWGARRRQIAVEVQSRFEDETLAERRQLGQQLEAIRRDLDAMNASIVSRNFDPNSDAFLAEFLQRHRERASYRDYHIAVFEPGLSAEQRRILFNGAVVNLGLSLPGPEVQPTTLPGTLLPVGR